MSLTLGAVFSRIPLCQLNNFLKGTNHTLTSAAPLSNTGRFLRQLSYSPQIPYLKLEKGMKNREIIKILNPTWDISRNFQTLPSDEVFPLLLKRWLFKRNSATDSVFITLNTAPRIRFVIQVDANPKPLFSQYYQHTYLLAKFTLTLLLVLTLLLYLLRLQSLNHDCLLQHSGCWKRKPFQL